MTPQSYGVLAKFERCHGEAHSNPYIDNCGVCAPNWGFILLCACCGAPLRYNSKAQLQRTCPKCGTTHALADYGTLWRDYENIIDAKIAAAVQAEREVSQPLIDALEYIAEVDNDGFAKHTYRNMIKRARAALVAIRARNEVKA